MFYIGQVVKIAQDALTTSFDTYYTTPDDTRTYVKDITAANTTAGALNLFVCLVPSGASAGTTNALIYTKEVAANDIYLFFFLVQLILEQQLLFRSNLSIFFA